jgi:hypothetical protein
MTTYRDLLRLLQSEPDSRLDEPVSIIVEVDNMEPIKLDSVSLTVYNAEDCDNWENAAEGEMVIRAW